MNAIETVASCAVCRICEGAAYQAPPALHLGSLDARIIVIAQNPGELHERDAFRAEMGKMMLEYSDNSILGSRIDANAIIAWYAADFIISPAYNRMAKVFGENWIKDKRILYTNAVRCRTRKNALPSKQMIEACFTWTRTLVCRPSVKALVFIGKVPAWQYLGEKSEKIQAGVIRRQADTGKLLLFFPHYVLWKESDIASYRETYESLAKSVGVKA